MTAAVDEDDIVDGSMTRRKTSWYQVYVKIQSTILIDRKSVYG